MRYEITYRNSLDRRVLETTWRRLSLSTALYVASLGHTVLLIGA